MLIEPKQETKEVEVAIETVTISLRKKKTTCGWKRILFLVTTILKFGKIVVGF